MAFATTTTKFLDPVGGRTRVFQKHKDSATNVNSHAWTVPAGETHLIQLIHQKYTSGATAGNRQLGVEILDTAGDTRFRRLAADLLAASTVRHVSYVPGSDLVRTVTLLSSSEPLPLDFIVVGGEIVKVFDSSAGQEGAAEDDLVTTINTEKLSGS